MDDVLIAACASVRTGAPRALGAELEWLAVDRAAPARRPDVDLVRRALAAVALPGGSLLSTEPGGQVELSSLPFAGPSDVVRALAADVCTSRAALDAVGVELVGLGVDPSRPPQRLLDTPRYAVMEQHFASLGRTAEVAGRAMMCSTAAVQVSVDAGLAGTGLQSATARWQRAHLVGPALVAAFACSPVLAGRVTGWRSTRQRIWTDVDPSRTRAPDPSLPPEQALAVLALGAQVLTVRDADGTCRPAPCGLTFGAWVGGDGPRRPTQADLDYHLTTLFPPVRVRGWYELRYLDALPDPLWQVAVGVVSALLDDDRAAEAAVEACTPVAGRWADAARHATTDPALARAATACLLAAAEALPRMGASALAADVAAYADRYAARGRCPADDLLDRLAEDPDPCSLLRPPALSRPVPA